MFFQTKSPGPYWIPLRVPREDGTGPAPGRGGLPREPGSRVPGLAHIDAGVTRMAQRARLSELLGMALAGLKWIPSRRSISARELHRHLEAEGYQRDFRSIQRLLEVLVASGLVDCDDRSKPHGYRLGSSTPAISLSGLNAREALLLALAEKHLRFLLPSNLQDSLRPFFEEARRLSDPLPPWPDSLHAREWMDKVRIVREGQPLLPPALDTGVVDAVSKALYSNLWLDITHRNAEGRVVRADVMPLGLVQQGVRLYLVARFRGFDNERNLALHRLAKSRVTDLGFERPAEFDLAAYEAEGRFGFGQGRRVRLHFSISPWAGQHL